MKISVLVISTILLIMVAGSDGGALIGPAILIGESLGIAAAAGAFDKKDEPSVKDAMKNGFKSLSDVRRLSDKIKHSNPESGGMSNIDWERYQKEMNKLIHPEVDTIPLNK